MSTEEVLTPSAPRERGYIEWLDEIWSRRLQTLRERKPDLSMGILLCPTFPMMSLTGIIEPLRHATDFADNSRPLHCRWSIMGGPGHAAVASCGIRVQADASYINPTNFDYIVVVGGLLPHLRAASSQHRDYLRMAASANVPVIGACTGAFILAQEGLLDGRKASVHPFHAEDFRLAFPRLAFSTRDDFLIDNGRITVPRRCLYPVTDDGAHPPALRARPGGKSGAPAILDRAQDNERLRSRPRLGFPSRR